MKLLKLTLVWSLSQGRSSNKKDYGIRKRKFKNKKLTERRKKTRKDIKAMKTESNRKYILQSRNYKWSDKSALSWIKICPYAYNKRNRIKKTTPYRLQRFC